MPRFFFNIRDGVDITDPVGTEYPSWQEARVEAIRLAGQVLKDDPNRLALGEDWYMEVVDEWGLVLFRLNFQVMESPAMMGEFRAVNPPQA